MHVADPQGAARGGGGGGGKLIEGCCSGAHQQLVSEGMDSIDQGGGEGQIE